MPTSPVHDDPPTIVASPAQLEMLGTSTSEIGRQVEAIAVSAGHALRDLAAGWPGAASAVAATEAGARLAELLSAEGVALQRLGAAFAAAAVSYRGEDAKHAQAFAAVRR